MKLDDCEHPPPSFAEVTAQRRAPAKGMPHQLVKKEKKVLKAALEKAFREGVWARDRGRSRASGKPLAKSGVDYDRVGEIHHMLKRSTDPDRIYDVSNGILLSATEHKLAETACPNDPAHCLLDIDGPEDRALPQVFTFRDVNGQPTRKPRIG